ncbi:MAG TPA: SWIM zinc finger family protein [Ilumatobacteraceae bacterium]|nr:SWIM zinc finger family protein [Ilumatobacteraceae bacterium]
MGSTGRWTIEQVVAVAPSPSSLGAAESIATPQRWIDLGCDDRSLWGRCSGSGAEPYETAVDHVDVAWRCSCPSRKLPCKHAVALLVMWVRGVVPEAAPPAAVARWVRARAGRADGTHDRESTATPGTDAAIGTATGTAATGTGTAATGSGGDPEPSDRPEPEPEPAPLPAADADRARDERVARMREGLVELDRWLEDRIRTGLSDPSLARYATWDDLAARLVDARAGALANRIRRLAGVVGSDPDWHARVLAELGVLHLLAQAGQRLPDLPGALADSVAAATGWQVRHADVLAGVPDTDHWIVAGRSDTREDRIEVRRCWLRGASSGRWAMVLSFAAYRQSLDTSLTVGTAVRADLHRYPGPALRALVGERFGDPEPLVTPPASSIIEACDEIGGAIALEPWLERHPATVLAAMTRGSGRWMLTDDAGHLPLVASPRALATVLAATGGELATLTVEWTPHGVIPLTVHAADRALDVGPVADPSFVEVA